MAWTSPRTWVAGEVLTAGLLNTHVRDNFTALRENPWNTLYEGADSYNSTAPSPAAVIPGGGPYNVTVETNRTLEVRLEIPRLEMLGVGGLQVWIAAGSTIRGGYWENPSSTALSTGVELSCIAQGSGGSIAINVWAFKLGTNGGSIRGIVGQQGPRIKYRVT